MGDVVVRKAGMKLPAERPIGLPQMEPKPDLRPDRDRDRRRSMIGFPILAVPIFGLRCLMPLFLHPYPRTPPASVDKTSMATIQFFQRCQ